MIKGIICAVDFLFFIVMFAAGLAPMAGIAAVMLLFSGEKLFGEIRRQGRRYEVYEQGLKRITFGKEQIWFWTQFDKLTATPPTGWMKALEPPTIYHLSANGKVLLHVDSGFTGLDQYLMQNVASQ
jgi:hypothetical protein